MRFSPVRIIEVARENKALTQVELAKQALVDRWFISALERGQALASPDQAKRIAAILGVDPSRLTDEVELPLMPDLAPAVETTRG